MTACPEVQDVGRGDTGSRNPHPRDDADLRNDAGPDRVVAAASALADTARGAAGRPLPEAVNRVIDALLPTGPWACGSVRPVDAVQTITSSLLAQECDRLQVRAGTGPTTDALRADVQAARDLSVDTRWPVWSGWVRKLGISGVVAVRLHAGGTVGVLTLYADRPITADAQLTVAHLAGAHLSVLVATATRQHHLERGLAARTRVGQAQGILMYRHELTAEDAFLLLRRTSQRHNIKIAVLARHVIRTGRLPIL